jgi:hypothetical protein
MKSRMLVTVEHQNGSAATFEWDVWPSYKTGGDHAAMYPQQVGSRLREFLDRPGIERVVLTKETT